MKVLILITIAVISFSCAKIFIEPDPSGDAQKNFTIFWNDLHNTYPYFQRDKVDWQALYDKNYSRIKENTTVQELFIIIQDLLRPLQDGHISLVAPNGDTWQNEKYYNYYKENYYGVYEHYNKAVATYLGTTKKYVTSPDEKDATITDTIATYGFVGNDILYFHVYTYYTKFSFETLVSKIIAENSSPIKGIILDVRDNTGGNISTMINFMSIFFPGTTTYAYFKEKIGPLENDFSDNVDYNIEPNSNKNNPIFTKPIVCLTNRFTVSAGEHTVLAMRIRPNTTVVGDTTAGGLSFIVQRTLPDGIKYIGVSSQTFDTKNNLYEGLGIPPQISAENTALSNSQNKDLPIEKALEILNQ